MEHYAMSHKFQATAAEGEGVLVSYNYHENRKTPLPEELKQRIRALEQSVTKNA
jgi:acyl-CoA thioester hydrolase